MKANIFLLILIASSLSLFSQDSEPCYFDQVTNKKSLLESERQIQAKIKQQSISGNERSSSDSIRTIPVVVHIIHNGSSENISEAQVQSQIQVLNEDFGKIAGTNGDGSGVDTEVRFCLAKIDPDGNCTNGIVRVKSPLSNHQAYQRPLLKALSFWDNTRYLNIYIVKNINGNVGGRIEAAAEGGVMENSLIMDKGNLIIPESDDPMKGNIESVNAALNTTLNSISKGLRDTLIKIKAITS